MENKIEYKNIENEFNKIIAETQKNVNKEMLDQIELSKTYKRDKDHITGLVELLKEVIVIFKTAKSKIEKLWIDALNAGSLSKVYDNMITEAITCLQDKENIIKALEDIDKEIKSNNEIIEKIRKYYEARKKDKV